MSGQDDYRESQRYAEWQAEQEEHEYQSYMQFLEQKCDDLQARLEWQPIETAPKDGTKILGWCDHEADKYFLQGGKYLTPYGANAEGMSHVDDGINIVQWHEELDEFEYVIPAWWCLADGYGETAANPTHWMPLPEPPALQQGGPCTHPNTEVASAIPWASVWCPDCKKWVVLSEPPAER